LLIISSIYYLITNINYLYIAHMLPCLLPLHYPYKRPFTPRAFSGISARKEYGYAHH
jgi:hypothetical protein